MKRIIGGIIAVSSLLLAGCQSGAAEEVTMVEVIGQADHCRRDEPGLVQVTDRGDLPPETEDGIASSVTNTLDAGDSVLMVYLGQRPTPGYGASLVDAHRRNGALEIELSAREPDPGSMMAQVVTTPCLGLRIPAEGWSKIVVSMDAEGFPLTLD